MWQKAYHFLLFSFRRYGEADRAKVKNAEAALRDAKEKLSEVEKEVSVSFVSSEKFNIFDFSPAYMKKPAERRIERQV